MSYFQFKKSSPIELIQQIQLNSKLNQIERETFACGGCNWNEKKINRTSRAQFLLDKTIERERKQTNTK